MSFRRVAPVILLSALAPLTAAASGEADREIETNEFGWPIQRYVAFFGTLGAGRNPDSHNVGFHITRDGWAAYADSEVQPLLDGPNPPTRMVVHSVGPAWPRMRDGEPRTGRDGHIHRWFEYDWPLTVAEGREREDGQGVWRPLPQYLWDFADTWRGIARGDRSGGEPIETYAYTGLIQSPWLKRLRRSDPEAYQERLREVARFFRDAGFRGVYVDAAAATDLPADHLGLATLAEINAWPDFFVGVEAYPPAKHDATTGALPYFVADYCLKSQHPRWPDGRGMRWQSRLDRPGLVLWRHRWSGGAYRLTPDVAVTTAAMGDDIAISWKEWNRLAPELPPQRNLVAAD